MPNGPRDPRAVRPFPIGKLPLRRLEALLARLPTGDDRVIVGPQPGEDAAVIDFGDRYLVATTDPVTFTTDGIGQYAVHVNANDVAVMGARPRWFFATLLLPEGRATDALIDAITGDIAATCEALRVTVCGGHTEVTAGLDRPVVIGQMLGEVGRDRLVRKARLQAGDALLLTRGIAIEGTAILAREKATALRGRVPDDLLARAARFLSDPGISVVAAALAAVETGTVHAMHDPTEGGLVTGLCELARAAGAGLRVVADRIPVFPETRSLCEVLGIDPLRLIASGALLIGAPPGEAARLIDTLGSRGMPAVVIGEVLPSAEGVAMEMPGGHRVPLEPPARDEIARILGSQG